MARPDGFNSRPSTRPNPSNPSSGSTFGKDSNSVGIPKEILSFLMKTGQTLKDLPKGDDIYTHIKDVQKQMVEDEKQRKQSEAKLIKNLQVFLEKSAKETGMSQEDLYNNILKGTGGAGLLLDKEEREALVASGLSFQAIKDFKTEEEKSIKKRDEATKNFFSEHLKKLDKLIDNNTTLVRNTVLGPLSLLVAPFEDFAGSSLFQMGKGIKEKFIKKKNPSENDLAKEGKLGPLYLWNKLKKHFGKDKEDKGFDWKSLATKIPAGLLGSIMKGGAIAAIAAGVIWSVIDGIKGAILSKKWGVNKVEGFIGGFLGGTKSGWAGAFSNFGKWALMGVGIGFLAGGPVGALVGGLIGAAVGAILGYIGGEKIAKGLKDIGDQLAKASKGDILDKILGIPSILIGAVFDGMGNFFATIPEMIVFAITKDKKKAEFAHTIAKGFWDFANNFNPWKMIKNILDTGINIKNIMKDKKLTGNEKFKKIFFELATLPFKGLIQSKAIQNVMKSLSETKFGQSVTSIFSKGMNISTTIKDKAVNFAEQAKNFIKQLFTGISSAIVGFFNTNPIIKFINKYLIMPVVNFFKTISDTFGYLGSLGMGGIINLAKDMLIGKGDAFSKGFQNYQTTKELASTDYTDWLTKKSGLTPQQVRSYSNEDKLAKYHAYQEANVNDAIIKPDGSIIHTSPQDTIIATKNTPATDNTRYKLPTMDTTKGSSISTSKVEEKLDKVITLLQALLSKDPIVLPGQTRADLDAIIQGLIL